MDNKPNERKRTSGAIRDKDRTKNKMIQAVGKVLLKKGYTGLNASTIAKEAFGMDVFWWLGSVSGRIHFS